MFRDKSILLLRIQFLTLLCVGSLSTIVLAQAKTVKSDSPLRMRLVSASGRNDFATHEHVVLLVKLRNGGKETLILPQSCESLIYKFSVDDERGMAVPMSAEGRRMTTEGEMICSHHNENLQAGALERIEIDLSAMYEFKKKGVYNISVQRFYRRMDLSWVRSNSNVLQVRVQ